MGTDAKNGYKKITQNYEIRGFWNRVGDFEGRLIKLVHGREGDFFMFEALEGTNGAKVVTREDGDVEIKRGEIVGVSAFARTDVLNDLLKIPGRYMVLLSSNGKREIAGGKTFWDIEVFAKDLGDKPLF